ncbi:bifunctional adenosylcobinamide kinase/adenosylcobinamide-phosphate guanylyltransferase [Sporosarcina sp. Te-1]|uniref:bifunctional adenosylcobinamide kinase/adenosylcobinamide-phosphate guanylyltransferase n=1 Tax=Sporosarcina sp. Te-1 TaxID=2818390 RepID=UPI001A9F0562|nr:bifunctional adenosylcobinamide kinase/adenosylcobinamide-phosphate guanylyltransferase [Sporosarcina sp. Te-1]QTD40727.1 bifunctional adenosylcobinamide kinase/adenosylcobinamide-phosphate guanylyltransferase [Sporosarcina sp. Te-1]
MHIFIGGAHNGKREFVRNWLKEPDKWAWVGPGHAWDLERLAQVDSKFIVLDRIEEWLESSEMDETDALAHIMRGMEGKETVVILTDLGRGIVPVDPEQRKLRDRCGRLYQWLIAEADEVTRIWYGLAQTLKKRG